MNIEVSSKIQGLKRQRKNVVKQIRCLQEKDSVLVTRKPLNSTKPPLAPFAKDLFRKGTMKQNASNLSVEDTLDELLLVLFDALLLSQAEEWTKRDVANLTADETYERRGLAVEALG